MHAHGCGGVPDRAPPSRRLAACLLTATLATTVAAPAVAQWTPPQLDQLTQSFVQAMGPAYTVRSFPWTWSSECDGTQCYGDNPDTTYGYPLFGPAGTSAAVARTMDATGALVFIAETPPPMRYFGFTPYLYSKYYTTVPYTGQPGYVAVYQSLTDTRNLLNVGTTGSTKPGTNVFTQLAVYVMTADATTAADISSRFAALGFPSSAVNLQTLPLSNVPPVPLAMGNGLRKDTFSALFRLSYPEDAEAMASYVARTPIRTLYLEPASARAVAPLPPTVYRTPGNGQAESAALRRARDQLASQLLAQYQPQFRSTLEAAVSIRQTRNYACVTLGISCAGDNPDALYMSDFGGASYTPGPDDRFLVVGVHHSSGTGKATYFSHSLTNATNSAGLLSVTDTWLRGTGLLAAGITNPADPRYAAYSRLYAFYMSYNCPPGDPICVRIPTDPANGGVPLGTPLEMAGRMYLEPATATRPSNNEVVLERVFWLQK